LPERCAISCDNVITIPIEDLDDERVAFEDDPIDGLAAVARDGPMG
jgi:hypothetical protein